MTATGRAGRVCTAIALGLLLLAAVASAHPAGVVEAQARVDSDGAYSLRVRFDVLSYVLNESPRHAALKDMDRLLGGPTATLERALTDAGERFGDDLTIVCDDVRELHGSVASFPAAKSVADWTRDQAGPRYPVLGEAVITGRLPPGTRNVAFGFAEVLGEMVLTVERPGEEPWGEAVPAGGRSVSLPVRLGPTTGATDGLQPSIPLEQAHTPGVPSTAGRFVRWGFLHIVPYGLDHVLFVLGLFLLNARLRPLLIQITSFTVAHSITLGLATMGMVRAPGSVVEPLIAASIVFVALENLFTTELKPWRPAVVFLFGLVHGMGFASVLGETALPSRQLAVGLVAFNVGVELGQLSVIALAFLLLGWWSTRRWYRPAIVMPASLLIALVATVWTVQRLSGVS